MRTTKVAREVTDDQIIAALEATGGLVSAAAQKLGVHRNTITNRRKRSKRIREAEHGIVESILDLAEGKLIGLIRDGHPPSIMFYLKCKGKERGYIERGELTGPDGKPIDVNATVQGGVVVVPGTADDVESYLESLRKQQTAIVEFGREQAAKGAP